MAKHPSLADEVPRLNRAIGQLEAVRRMIGEGQYCVDVMTQLRAARSAIKAIELSVLETHMNACVSDAIQGGSAREKDKKLSEIMELLKKYE